MSIEIFDTVPEIIQTYRKKFPGAEIHKSKDQRGQLCLTMIFNRNIKSIYIRECQGSGYYTVEVINDVLNKNKLLN